MEVYLPVVETPIAAVERERPRRVVGGTETILVAEDESMVRRLVAEILEEVGYTVVTACDGREALALFEQRGESVDLMLMDVVMPGLSGTAVMKALQARGARVPFLFSSGYNEDMVHTNFPVEGGYSLIRKPYRREELLEAVRAMLDGRPVPMDREFRAD